MTPIHHIYIQPPVLLNTIVHVNAFSTFSKCVNLHFLKTLLKHLYLTFNNVYDVKECVKKCVKNASRMRYRRRCKNVNQSLIQLETCY